MKINSDLGFEWYIVCYVWVGLFWFLLTIILIYGTYQQFCSKSAKQPIKIFRYFTFLVILLCWMGNSLDIAHITVHMLETHDFDSDVEPIIAGFGDIIYFASTIVFYVLLIAKLWFVFNGTVYQLSKCTLIFMLIFVVLLVVGAVIHVKDTAFTKGSNDYTKKERPFNYYLSVTDFVLNFSLFYLFWYKIRQTILSVEVQPLPSHVEDSYINNPHGSLNDGVDIMEQKENNEPSTSMSLQSRSQRAAPYNPDLYDPSIRLFEVISKHTILFGIALITNQCFYVGMVLEDILDVSDENYSAAILILFSARALENFINALVVWLMLSANYIIYIRLCGCCHRVTQRFCKCITPKNHQKKKKKIKYNKKSGYYEKMKTVDDGLGTLREEEEEYNDRDDSTSFDTSDSNEDGINDDEDDDNDNDSDSDPLPLPTPSATE